jgi:hypothetical protein
MEIHYNRRRLKFTAATLLHPAEVNVTSPDKVTAVRVFRIVAI